MQQILEQAMKKAEAAEVFNITSEETPLQFEADRLKHIQSKQSFVTAFRIIKNGRIGYSVSSNPDDVDGLINTALETAEFGMQAEFELPPPTAYKSINIYDPKVESVPLEDMIALGEEMIGAVKGHTRDMICEAGVSRDIISVKIMNSKGNDAGYSKSIFSLSIEGSLIRGTDMLFVAESESSCHPLIQTKTITDVILRQLDWAKERAVVTAKKMPVIFTPNGVAAALISPLMSGFNGKTVLEGASPIGDSLGKLVFDKKLNLYDDATIDYRPGSHPFDDEGIASRRTPLIEDGYPTNFLYDLQTAALAGKESTGNGHRGGRGLPSPSANAFIIPAGGTSFEEMLADIKQGLVVEYLMGAGQGNVLGGDFSGNILLGYKVENGKIKGRVKDTMVSGNVYHVLKDIAAIGSDARWMGGFLYSPSLYCPSLSVAVKK
jgi:PmbA protein